MARSRFRVFLNILVVAVNGGNIDFIFLLFCNLPALEVKTIALRNWIDPGWQIQTVTLPRHRVC